MVAAAGPGVNAGSVGIRRAGVRTIEPLLGWQLHCHPQEKPAIQGRQYNCRPNIEEN
jgi:hypothetical protein